MSHPVRPSLTQPRAEAERRLGARIDQAKEIIPGRIRTTNDLTQAEEREKRWRAYNVDMLDSMFTSNAYANEYANSKILVHQIADRYNDPSLDVLAVRLLDSLRSQVASLESIVERLEFVNEPSTGQPTAEAEEPLLDRTKVFVVHGHDEAAIHLAARFLEHLGLEAIVLREQPDQGRAIIEKFVDCAADVGFAVVLLTPDDLGGPAATSVQSARARQNVIFELGYFAGKLGRGRACLLRKGEVEIPSDLYGVIYTDMDPAEGWKRKLALELRAAGFDFDPAKVFA
jgi:predicted nucleotide-binding protein